MITAAITGHRPEKIADQQWVMDSLTGCFVGFDVTRVIQGMAAGVDLWAARAAHEAGIPYVCARPWAGHKPRKGWEHYYESALRNSAEVVDVDPSLEYPGVWVYQKRNKWMVDHADFLISVWNGTSGGTANCVVYAQKVGMSVLNCNPETKTCEWLV